jgi:hypothetical protein
VWFAPQASLLRTLLYERGGYLRMVMRKECDQIPPLLPGGTVAQPVSGLDRQALRSLAWDDGRLPTYGEMIVLVRDLALRQTIV